MRALAVYFHAENYLRPNWTGVSLIYFITVKAMFQATLLYSFLQHAFCIRCRVFMCLVNRCFQNCPWKWSKVPAMKKMFSKLYCWYGVESYIPFQLISAKSLALRFYLNFEKAIMCRRTLYSRWASSAWSRVASFLILRDNMTGVSNKQTIRHPSQGPQTSLLRRGGWWGEGREGRVT